MPTDILKLWPKDSDGTVIRRKGFVQLGHLAADARLLFDQMDLQAHVPQIKGSLHARYPTTNDQYILVHENLPSLLGFLWFRTVHGRNDHLGEIFYLDINTFYKACGTIKMDITLGASSN